MAMTTSAAITHLTLANGALNVALTPDIGGRLLGVSLAGHDNFLYTGDAVAVQPNPLVSPEAGHIPYMGHEMWVGPQSQWWQQQLVNSERHEAKAVWPPDPYLVLAKNNTLSATPQGVILRSPASPVSGVVMEKSYTLVADNPNQLQLDVSVQNIRDSQVSWDIWFNSRVTPDTQVYLPVASLADIVVNNIEDDIHGPLAFSLEQGIFHLDSVSVPANKRGRKGKLLIQPSHGWLAAFRTGQLLIIQFAHEPKTAIHPEQGQVELYLEFPMEETRAGVLELEVHAPYETLQPKQVMSAQELWTLVPYDGEDTAAAQLEFLRREAKRLGLAGL